ncbi:MAG: indolepyruvate oxidoreductase subunit beta family protein [Rhizobiaceae bacterium]
MTSKIKLDKKAERDYRVDAIIKMAILAVGGQGGGVLSSWIVDVAKRNNYHVQATSVAGVAQRTGATIYYLEMLPSSKRRPVFSLAPSPGDVDIVISAELMEAGRAIMRGFVTPDRTTLITSTHRAFATAEKIVPGDAIADSGQVYEIAKDACDRLIAFDMETIAIDAGSVVSASLFGALAGSGAMPFAQQTYEDTITASGRGVEASLKAFRAGYLKAQEEDTALELNPLPSNADVVSSSGPKVPDFLLADWEKLQLRVHAMPQEVQAMVQSGLNKVIDFQDLAYGAEYLDFIERVLTIKPDSGSELTITAAKYIANAMAYDDMIYVSDVKTRKSRFDRIKKDIAIGDKNVLRITEYFHPGASEFCSMMPLRLGQMIEASPKLFKGLDWLVNRGRRVRTDTLFWFIMLYLVSGLKRFRRKLLRHDVEQKHLKLWLNTALSYADSNYDLATETLKCRRLIKGYSDTHRRGVSKFDRVLASIELVKARDDAADWARRLREAALNDVDGKMLDGAIETIASFMHTEK